MKSSLTATIGAFALIAALLVFGVNVVGDSLIPVQKAVPSNTASSDPAPSPTAKTKPAALTVKTAPTAPPTKTADVTDAIRGAQVFNKCKACHTATNGGKNKFGPNLWDIVGRAKASADGYKYSDALSGLGGEWSYADLDAFLKAPKKFAPGTKMPFAGLKKAADRAAVIAFLRGPNAPPKPLP